MKQLCREPLHLNQERSALIAQAIPVGQGRVEKQRHVWVAVREEMLLRVPEDTAVAGQVGLPGDNSSRSHEVTIPASRDITGVCS